MNSVTAIGVNQADGDPERSYTNGHTPPILRSPSLIAGDPNSVNGTMLFDESIQGGR